MFKKFILLTSIFALTACNEDVYDEIDQQIEDGELPMTTNRYTDK